MHRHRKHSAQPLVKPAARSFAILLLLLYAVSATDIVSLHDHETVVLHTEEAEQDACHLSIFHNVDKSCGHEKHLIAKESCAVCDMVMHRDSLLPHLFGKSSSKIFTNWIARDGGDPFVGQSFLLPARAPPVA